jgi:hypothetical protein
MRVPLRQHTGKEFELETLEERILLSGDPLLDPLSSVLGADQATENSSSPDPTGGAVDSIAAEEDALKGVSSKLSYNPNAMLDDLFAGLETDEVDPEDLVSDVFDVAETVSAETAESVDPAVVSDLETAELAIQTDAEIGAVNMPALEITSPALALMAEVDQLKRSTYDHVAATAPPAVNPVNTGTSAQKEEELESADSDEDTLLLVDNLRLDAETDLGDAKTLIIGAGAELSGIGSFDVNIVNQGVFSPGNSPGTVTQASFTQAAGATLVIQISGINPGPGTFDPTGSGTGTDGGYDQINTTGTDAGLGNAPIQLDGDILLVVDPAFENLIAAGDTFNILTYAVGGSISASFGVDGDGKFADGEGLYGFGSGNLYLDLEEYTNADGSGGLRVVVKEINGADFTSSIEPASAAKTFGKFLSSYFSVDGSIQLTGFKIDIGGFLKLDTGDFGIEKLGGQLRLVSDSASASLVAGNFRASLASAELIVVLNSDGTRAMGTSGGVFSLTGANLFNASATAVSLQLNDSAVDYSVAAGAPLTVTTTGALGTIAATLSVANGANELTATGAKVEIGNFATLAGDFAFQSQAGNISAVLTNASALLIAGNFAAGVTAASVALVLNKNNKIALRAVGTPNLSGDGLLNLGATSVTLAYNDTGTDYSGQSVNINGVAASLDVVGAISTVEIKGLQIDIANFVTLGGDYNFALADSELRAVSDSASAEMKVGNFAIGLAGGTLALVFNDANKIALKAVVTGGVTVRGTGLVSPSAASVTVAYNDTSTDYQATALSITIGSITQLLDVGLATASISVQGLQILVSDFVTLGGDFGFRLNGATIEATASGAFATLVAGSYAAGVTNGSLALVLNSANELAFKATGDVRLQGDKLGSATGTAIVGYNNSAVDYAGTPLLLNINGVSSTLDIGDGVTAVASVAMQDVVVVIGGFATFGGNFGLRLNGTSIEATASAAFARLTAGDVIIGVTNGTLALLIAADNTLAVTAVGDVQFVGGKFGAVTGTTAVNFNNSAVDHSAAPLLLDISGVQSTLVAAAGVTSVSITGMSLIITDFVTITGDFGFALAGTSIIAVADNVGVRMIAGSLQVGIDAGSLGMQMLADSSLVIEAQGTPVVIGAGFTTPTAVNVLVRYNNSGLNYTGIALAVDDIDYLFVDMPASADLIAISIVGFSADFNDFVTLSGDFGFKLQAGEITATASNVAASIKTTSVSAGLNNGSLGFVYKTDGTIALEAQGSLVLTGGGIGQVSAASVAVRFNNTNASYTGATVTGGDVAYTFENLAASTSLQSLTVNDLRGNISDIQFGGNFAIERNVDVIRATASGAFAFIESGDFKVGVNNGSLALIIDAANTVALQVSGALTLVGSDFAAATADTATVRFNNSAVDYDAAPITVAINGVSADLTPGLVTKSVSLVNLQTQYKNLFTLSGDFGLTVTGVFPSTEIRAVADNVSIGIVSGGFSVGANNGTLAMLINADRTSAITATGSVFLTGAGFGSATATLATVNFNNTGVDYSAVAETINVDVISRDVVAADGVSSVSIADLSVQLGDFATLTGNFAFSLDNTGLVTAVANTVGVVIEAGDFQVGMTDGDLGLVINPDGTKALQAGGSPFLIGGGFSNISATRVEVSYNDTGKAYTGITLTIDGISFTYGSLDAIDLQRATVLGLAARFGDFVTLGGDFQFERNVVGADV